MVISHARGLLKVGEQSEHYSMVGSKFVGTILEETTIELSDPGIATCTNNT